jgi:hypothetical protein
VIPGAASGLPHSSVHPEGGNFDRANGSKTDPVPLHPGAHRHFMNRHFMNRHFMNRHFMNRYFMNG